jgi:hypothetical protein
VTHEEVRALHVNGGPYGERAYGKQSFPDTLHGAWLERASRNLGRWRIDSGEALASFPLAVPFRTHANLWGD